MHAKSKPEDLGLTKDDFKTVGQSMVKVIMLLASHGEARYAGKNVELGDAETAIFWYRPKDSETYKVIYGDLSIEDVAEEDLPAEPVSAEDVE